MKKTTLYIIHGWTYTVSPWEKTIADLEKKGLKIEMLHVPGLTSPSKKVWTIEEYVKWADRHIPDGSVALGHSNGGRILLNLCSKNPAKLKHLILLDAAGVYENNSKRDLSRSISKRLGFLKKVPGLTKVWHKLTGATDYAKAPENMKRTLANMLDSDKNLDLSSVTTPTSILWGKEDTVTPPRQSEVMHAKIPGSTLELFPGWPHAPYISHPAELARAIYRTVGKPPKPTTADAAAVSASLALKKAPEPVLERKGPHSSVAPNVPTKLVLRNDEKTPTTGLVVSDAEGAAVRYSPKRPEIVTRTTNATKVSASANLKKVRRSVVPDIDVTKSSASASLKSSPRKENATSLAITSASLSLKQKSTSKDSSEPEHHNTFDLGASAEFLASPIPPSSVNPAPIVSGAITSASVPKISPLEKAKRKVRGRKASPATSKKRER